MTDKTAVIGSIVFFKQPKTEPVLAAGRVHPALVTGAKPDGSLSLRVFIDGVESVRLIRAAQPYDETSDSGWSEDFPGPRDNGPTLTEYVAAGYNAAGYPPPGYAAKPMTPEEQAIYDAAKAGEPPVEEVVPPVTDIEPVIAQTPPPESPPSKASQEITPQPEAAA